MNTHVLRIAALTVASLSLALVACGNNDMEVQHDDGTMSWNQFLSVVYQEPSDADGPGVFIADGDEVFDDETELRAFYDSAIAKPDGEYGSRHDALIVDLTSTGKDNKWSAAKAQDLTYCVSTKFGTHYDDVVQAMADATAAWEAVANVHYVHVSSKDSNCTKSTTGVIFDVNPVNAGGQYLARSFFPDTSRKSRNVLIDPSSWNLTAPLTLTGILRHELGHTLGFRHEHTRPEAGTCFEDNGWRALTPYDSDSVMHYPQCNGTGDWSLTLTTKDKQGAKLLYPF